MYNWSTNTIRLRQNPREFAIFKLEQAINFGLNNQKLSSLSLKKYWPKLHLDPAKKRYLHSLLWP